MTLLDDSLYPLLAAPCPGSALIDSTTSTETVWQPASRRPKFSNSIARFHLEVIDRTIVFIDVAMARDAVARFAEMNRDWWASETEAYIYNEFADALQEGFRSGVLTYPTS